MKRKRQVQEVSNSHKQVHVITVMMVYMFTLLSSLGFVHVCTDVFTGDAYWYAYDDNLDIGRCILC